MAGSKNYQSIENKNKTIEQIGQRIKRIRIAKGMTQEELAILMGYSNRSAINKIESGTYNINQKQILKLATIFEMPVEYLVTGEENKRVNKMIITTVEDCVYSCELDEAQMKCARELMEIFIKENKLKDKAKVIIDKAKGI